MFSRSSYSVRRVILDPGDCLLLYTDGISEANNPSGKEYGVSRLAQFAGSRHNWAPDDLLTASLQDIEEFAAGTRQRDDQTLMVLHRNGVGSKGSEAFA